MVYSVKAAKDDEYESRYSKYLAIAQESARRLVSEGRFDHILILNDDVPHSLYEVLANKDALVTEYMFVGDECYTRTTLDSDRPDPKGPPNEPKLRNDLTLESVTADFSRMASVETKAPKRSKGKKK
jgi:hypothetical protein